MTLEERIAAFDSLGSHIRNLHAETFNELARKVENGNNWFTPSQTAYAIDALSSLLNKERLWSWLAPYQISEVSHPKKIGLLLAGNIPAVGFHDMLSVLIAGHEAHVKLSASDQIMIKWLVGSLLAIEPRFESFVFFEEMLKGKDAYIATGSDNSARYFDYYFGKYPNIIRKNRTSVGVLDGNESRDELHAFGRDIFQYYGLGCRNVSKIFVRNKETLIRFLDAIEDYKSVADHHKYANNYDYNKSIYLVNREPHLDNGFLLLNENKELVSPISVLYYENYNDERELGAKIGMVKEKIQCIVSRAGWYPESTAFGLAQCPTLDEYADGVDTISFLTRL